MLGTYGGYGGMMGGAGFFGLLTWLVLITFLVLGCIFFWQRINKK